MKTKYLILLLTGFFIMGCAVGYLQSDIKFSKNKLNMRAYQIELDEDSTVIYDGERRVVSLPIDTTQRLDKAIFLDNE